MQSQLACIFTNHTTNAVLKLQERGDYQPYYHLLCPLFAVLSLLCSLCCALFAVLFDVALNNPHKGLNHLDSLIETYFHLQCIFLLTYPSSILSILALQ